MSKIQGDGYKTTTDTEMNKRVEEHEKKWKEMIKPYYDSLVNEQVKEFEFESTEEYKVIIRTKQFNKVECTGKTSFYLGTLNKDDYRVTETIYIVSALTIDKNTKEENCISNQVFEGKENKNKANEAFKILKTYLS